MYSIPTTIPSEKIKLYNDVDLNSLFNLNYNFESLKGIISTLLKNQELIQKQLNTIYNSNIDGEKIIQNINNKLTGIENSKIDKNIFANLEIDFNSLKEKLNSKKDDEGSKFKFLIFHIFFSL